MDHANGASDGRPSQSVTRATPNFHGVPSIGDVCATSGSPSTPAIHGKTGVGLESGAGLTTGQSDAERDDPFPIHRKAP